LLPYVSLLRLRPGNLSFLCPNAEDGNAIREKNVSILSDTCREMKMSKTHTYMLPFYVTCLILMNSKEIPALFAHDHIVLSQ
jgi:hypothetical protein